MNGSSRRGHHVCCVWCVYISDVQRFIISSPVCAGVRESIILLNDN